jgi:hypothetical protein
MEAIMFAQTDYQIVQIVVTYRDGNLLWKDFVVDPHDVTVRVVSPTERDVTCVVPTFWSRIPRFARLMHVRITVDGRTLSLPWPPPDPLDAVERTATASPALTIHLRLHAEPDQAPTAVAWDDQKQQAFDHGSDALHAGKLALS